MKRLILLILAGVIASAVSAQGIKREDLGRSEKLRILVDKVTMPEEDWHTKEWIVRETAEAGFNVFSPRLGNDDLVEVGQVTQWCDQYGIFHMPWMRGTLAAPDGPEADGKRVMWSNGAEQPLYSACSDEFWEWTQRYIVEYARMSAENEHIFGVFLDYENYASGAKMGNLYGITYEDVILQPFLVENDLELPDIEPGERKTWLEEQGMHEGFAQYQIDHWRARCKALREAVDEHDPTFQFCIYPAPGTPFMVEACYPEWSTDVAPAILADPWVYGRPSRFLPQAESLESNQRKLIGGMQIPEKAGIPFIYSGGIDPVVTGADPEFCGKNAVMISELTGGYWVFYEGPKYDEDHPEYFRWFAWANERITAGELQAWHEPRETEEGWALDVFARMDEDLELVMPEVTGETVEFPQVTFRNENLFLLAVKKGQVAEIVLENVPVGTYDSPMAWSLRNEKLEKIDSGMTPANEGGTIQFTPESDGVYMLGASAGRRGYRITSANVPVGLHASAGLAMIYAAERMYVHVPEGVDELAISADGMGGETVRVNILGPDGEVAATGQTTLVNAHVDVRAPVGDGADDVWSIATAKADEGVVEDYKLRIGEGVVPILSLSPDHVFRMRRGK